MKITIDCGTDEEQVEELKLETGDEEGVMEFHMRTGATEDYLILGEKEIRELIKAPKAFI